MSKTVHYIGNYDKINEKFWDNLVAFYGNKGYELKPYKYNSEKAPTILLLLNPVEINTNFYDIHLLWVAYFKKNRFFQDSKILISGFANQCAPYETNYLSFVDYEEEFEKIVTNLKTVKELDNYKEEHITRANILKALLDFFKGHNDRSLFQRFNYLEMALKNIYYTTTEEIQKSFEEGVKQMRPIAIEEWKNFENRWKFYKNFLNSTPFNKEEGLIQEGIKFINDFLKEEKEEITVENIKLIVDKVEFIRHNLNEMNKYVQ
jgi:hypothetical protein